MRIRILLIEDSRADARLIREMLGEARDVSCRVILEERLSDAMKRLENGEKAFDAVLLDLTLPDSRGLDTFTQAHARAPAVPIVVLSGLDDEETALSAMRAGAQDYLIKGEVTGPLLARAVRYAIERQALLHQLEAERQKRSQEEEFHSLDRMTGSGAPEVTAQVLGLGALRETAPDVFEQLVQAHGDLLDRSLEQRVYKTEFNVSEDYRSLGERLGYMKAGPRDVIEVHTHAMKQKTGRVAPEKARAYMEEGRLRLLEIMGYLASYYRHFAL
jgi:DNA-binding NarL/FixJ family response regulator